MPSPCDSCKETCADGKSNCGSDCKCGADCKCGDDCKCAGPPADSCECASDDHTCQNA